MEVLGPYIMREIPKSVKIDPVLCALLHVTSFLEFSDEETVELDASVSVMNNIGLYLGRLTPDQIADVGKQLDALVTYARKRKWAKGFIDFVQRFLQTFDISESQTAKPKKKAPAAAKRKQDPEKARRRSIKRFVGDNPGNPKSLRKLLESDRKIAQLDLGDRDRPLHMASLNGHTENVRILLEFGAKPRSRNRWKETPLHKAALNGHLEIVRLLIEAGADVNARTVRGETPIGYAPGDRADALLKEYGGTT